MSQYVATPTEQATVTVLSRASFAVRSVSRRSAIRDRLSVVTAASAQPASVGRAGRLPCTRSGTPTSSSSRRTAWLIAGCVTFISDAAPWTEPDRTTAAKAVSRRRGGSGRSTS